MFELSNEPRVAVIVNADDLGYSEACDEATFLLIAQGAVTSASLLVNMQNSRKAVQRCLQIGFRAGLHLNLTEGKPLGDKGGSLVNASGQFLGKAAFYPVQGQPPQLKDEDLYEEISRQFEWFVREFNRLPTHIDGHNHVHMVPGVAKILVVVMEQYGCYKYRLPVEPLVGEATPFRKRLMQNIQLARPYYQRSNMISTGHFLGLELIYSFRFEELKTSLEKINAELKQSGTRNPVYVELMVHPGLIQQSSSQVQDEFHTCQNRQVEFEILASNQMKELLKQFRLVSWHQLSYPKPFEEKRLLLHSLMKRGTGNYTSCLRLRDILVEMGYKVYLRNIQEHSSQIKINEVGDIEEFCRQFVINLAIGINIYRSGIQLKDSFYHKERICYQTPYYLIIAGTDANIYLKMADLREPMLEAMRLSQGLIALNESLAQEVRQEIGENSSTSIELIPQSDNEYQPNATQLEEVRRELSIGPRPYIIFPASIRKVKDVGFALLQLNRIIERYDLDVYVLGPIIEQNYADVLLPQLDRVRYVGTVSHNRLLALLKNSVCLINTSISEGMSNAILEAQINRVLPVVRANDGNRHLVQHQQTGLLFDTAEQFQQNIVWVLEHPQEVKQLVEQAYSQAIKRFSREKEVASYKKLLDLHFSKESHLECNGKKFIITGSQHSHPVSLVNCQLFNQMPSTQGSSVLDLGCGTGVLSFYFLAKNSVRQLLLSDISYRTLGNCLFNIVQNHQMVEDVDSIKFIHSDMFTEINKNNLQYDVLLANMPQTPFPVDGVKLDKNGGRDGIKYNKIVLEQIAAAHKPVQLISLYSHMSWPKQYFSSVESLNLDLVWQTEPLSHRIGSTDFDRMAPGLNEYLLKLRAEDVCRFEIEQPYYLIPAQLLLIRKR